MDKIFLKQALKRSARTWQSKYENPIWMVVVAVITTLTLGIGVAQAQQAAQAVATDALATLNRTTQ